MTKSFQHKDAQKNKIYYKSLLRNLRKTVIVKQKYYNSLQQKIFLLIERGYFSDNVVRRLNHKSIDFSDVQFTLFLGDLYRCIMSTKYVDACDSLLNTYSADLENNLKMLSVAANPILWLLATKKRKEDAELAFEKLEGLKNSSFVNTAVSVLEKIDQIASTDDSTVKEHYEQNQDAYLVLLQKINLELFNNKGTVPVFDSLKKNYEKYNQDFGELKLAVSINADNIKQAVEKLVGEELVNTLRGIPVEELAREKTGIKIKCLKDAGYCTLADVFCASAWQLASVYGVSEDSAYSIKTICDNYAKRIYHDIKIKLSLDNKTKVSTNVVQLIYSYICKDEIISKIDELESNCKESVTDNFDMFDSVGHGLCFMFVDNAEVDRVRNGYLYIKEIFASKYKPLATESTKNLRQHVSPDTAWEHFATNSIKYYNVIEQLCPGILGNDDAIYGLSKELASEIQDECFFPDGLICTLRKYQEWGVKYILHQGKVLLGDEMGLGKTIQAIATMVSLKNTGATHFLVVCPASVVANWCREISKHSKLRATKIHGAGKASAFRSWLKTGGVAVTNYESTSYIKLEDNYKFDLLVVDEAHYIKNEGAVRSINTRNLAQHTDRILLMTGTALENNVDEMISLIKILNPTIANSVSNIAFMSSAPLFREKIAPVYYRRKREDVLTELPDKIESKEWCTLAPVEELAYEEALLNNHYQEARRVSWNIDDLNLSSKAHRLKEIVEEAEAEGRKVLVFSFFLETIRKIHEYLQGKCLNPITGSVNVNRRQEIIDEFDNSPAGTVLLAQISSGGTGLNIQSASVVVICEPQFKPSIENQAISRAYRMGQSRSVLVYRLLSENTLDERLTEILEEKQMIFDAFADKSVAAQQSVEIDNTTFGNIIKEEIERINNKRGKINIVENNISVDEVVSTTANAEKYDYNPISETLCGKDYYDKIMAMSYKQLVQYLINKYGPAKFDYFTNEYCTEKNKKLSRTKEGLFCHHIDEDKVALLSNPQYARNNPFEYQKAERLVYCNLLEHFLLHILIAEERNVDNENEMTGIGGAVCFLCKDLNDLYMGNENKQDWYTNVVAQVKNNYDSYIVMLNRLWRLISTNRVLSNVYSIEDLAKGYDDRIYYEILRRLK